MSIRFCARRVGIAGATFFAFGLAIHDGRACAQATEDSSKMAVGCWSSESKKLVSDKCPTEVKDSYFLCLNETMAGGVEGNLSVTHTEFVQIEKVAPADLGACIKPNAGVSMMQYDVSVSKSPKNVVLLSELHHKCGVGDCKTQQAPLKGTLALDTDTLVFAPSSGDKVKFQRAKPAENKGDSK